MDESYWPADARDGDVVDLTIGEVLRRAAHQHGSSCALVDATVGDGRRWTYRELLADAEGLASALAAEVQQGERIAMCAPTGPEWVIAECAAALAGLPLVMIDPGLSSEHQRLVLEDSGAVALLGLGDPPAADNLPPGVRTVVDLLKWEDALAPTSGGLGHPTVDPSSAAMMLYTSGTTGRPKGVLLHHRAVVNVSRFVAARLGMGPGRDDVWINARPMYQAGGSVLAALGSAWHGATVVLLPNADPVATLEAVERERGTVMVAGTQMLIDAVRANAQGEHDLSSLRAVIIGGMQVAPSVIDELERALGIAVTMSYGQSETSSVLTQTWLDDSPQDKATTIGQPLPQVELKVVSPGTGDTVPTGQPGELYARGYQLMLGYHDLPNETSQKIDGEEWLHSGDVCTMDDRGYIAFVGRMADMISRRTGISVPRHIEDVVAAHPSVRGVAVVGVPSEEHQDEELAVGFVTLVPGRSASAGDLDRLLAERLPPVDPPDEWVFVDDFPVTASGKVRRPELRDLYLAGRHARVE